MKKIILLAFILIIVTGCSNGYARDNTAGEIIDIGYEELVSMSNNNYEYILQLSVKGCQYCELLDGVEDDYIKDHNITIYDYCLDRDSDEFSEQLDYITSKFPDFEVAPSMYWIDNEYQGHLVTFDTDDKYQTLDNFIVKFQIDKM